MVTAEELYERLNPCLTECGLVVLKPGLFQMDGVYYARSIGGIFSLRVNGMKFHFGNPFSSFYSGEGIIKTGSTKESVVKYIDWVLNSSDERALWIRDIIESGGLKGKSIVYYKELGEPSHANALDYLINQYTFKRI